MAEGGYIQAVVEIRASQLRQMVGHRQPPNRQGAAQTPLDPTFYPAIRISI
jgi:hypothetical protein